MKHFQCQDVSKQQSNAGICQVQDSVRFNQYQITNIPEPIPVRLLPNHTISTCNMSYSFTFHHESPETMLSNCESVRWCWFSSSC